MVNQKTQSTIGGKRYTQEFEIHNEKTFSLVVKFISKQLLLAIVARLDLELH